MRKDIIIGTAIGALMFALVAVFYKTDTYSLPIIAWLPFLLSMGYLTVTDFKTNELDSLVLYVLLGYSFLVRVATHPVGLTWLLICVGISFIPCWVLEHFEAMGDGDKFIVCSLCLMVGYKGFVLFVGLISLTCIPFIIYIKIDKGTEGRYAPLVPILFTNILLYTLNTNINLIGKISWYLYTLTHK